MVGEHDGKIHEDIGFIKGKVNDFCSRLERVETKVDHIDECLDAFRGEISSIRTKVMIIGGGVVIVLTPVVTYIVNTIFD